MRFPADLAELQNLQLGERANAQDVRFWISRLLADANELGDLNFPADSRGAFVTLERNL